jgi:hypothetical protein
MLSPRGQLKKSIDPNQEEKAITLLKRTAHLTDSIY